MTDAERIVKFRDAMFEILGPDKYDEWWRTLRLHAIEKEILND